MEENLTKKDLHNLYLEIVDLVKEKNYEEALKKCEEEYCEKNLNIQSQKIKILYEMGHGDKALEECNREFCRDNLTILSQKFSILIRFGKYEEVLNECKEEYCEKNISIRCLKNEALTLKTNLELSKKRRANVSVNSKKRLDLFLTQIYYDDIDIEQIKELNIDNCEKIILQIAYYEKHNKALGIRFVKSVKQNFEWTEEQRKIINRLSERLLIKKTIIFDIQLYCEILKCSIDFNYKVSSEKNEEKLLFNEHSKPKVESPTLVEKKIPKKEPRKMVGQEGKRLNRYTNNQNHSTVVSNVIQEVLLKDIFAREIFEIQKYIYLQMNGGTKSKNAIQAWDNFENLINKKVDDQNAYDRLLHIIDTSIKQGIINKEEQTARKLQK